MIVRITDRISDIARKQNEVYTISHYSNAMLKDGESFVPLSEIIGQYAPDTAGPWMHILSDWESGYNLYTKIRRDGNERCFWLSETDRHGLPSFVFARMETIPVADERFAPHYALFGEAMYWHALVLKVTYSIGFNSKYEPATATIVKQYAPYPDRHETDLSYRPPTVFAMQAQAIRYPDVLHFRPGTRLSYTVSGYEYDPGDGGAYIFRPALNRYVRASLYHNRRFGSTVSVNADTVSDGRLCRLRTIAAVREDGSVISPYAQLISGVLSDMRTSTKVEAPADSLAEDVITYAISKVQKPE